jgi:hypothetical protein
MINTLTQEIRIMTSGAFTAAHLELIPRLELLTGTAEALKRTLLLVKSIAYSARGSGQYVTTELYQRLEIADQVTGKSRLIGGGERVGASTTDSDLARSVIRFLISPEAAPRTGKACCSPSAINKKKGEIC